MSFRGNRILEAFQSRPTIASPISITPSSTVSSASTTANSMKSNYAYATQHALEIIEHHAPERREDSDFSVRATGDSNDSAAKSLMSKALHAAHIHHVHTQSRREHPLPLIPDRKDHMVQLFRHKKEENLSTTSEKVVQRAKGKPLDEVLALRSGLGAKQRSPRSPTDVSEFDKVAPSPPPKKTSTVSLGDLGVFAQGVMASSIIDYQGANKSSLLNHSHQKSKVASGKSSSSRGGAKEKFDILANDADMSVVKPEALRLLAARSKAHASLHHPKPSVATELAKSVSDVVEKTVVRQSRLDEDDNSDRTPSEDPYGLIESQSDSFEPMKYSSLAKTESSMHSEYDDERNDSAFRQNADAVAARVFASQQPGLDDDDDNSDEAPGDDRYFLIESQSDSFEALRENRLATIKGNLSSLAKTESSMHSEYDDERNDSAVRQNADAVAARAFARQQPGLDDDDNSDEAPGDDRYFLIESQSDSFEELRKNGLATIEGSLRNGRDKGQKDSSARKASLALTARNFARQQSLLDDHDDDSVQTASEDRYGVIESQSDSFELVGDKALTKVASHEHTEQDERQNDSDVRKSAGALSAWTIARQQALFDEDDDDSIVDRYGLTDPGNLHTKSDKSSDDKPPKTPVSELPKACPKQKSLADDMSVNSPLSGALLDLLSHEDDCDTTIRIHATKMLVRADMSAERKTIAVNSEIDRENIMPTSVAHPSTLGKDDSKHIQGTKSKEAHALDTKQAKQMKESVLERGQEKTAEFNTKATVETKQRQPSDKPERDKGNKAPPPEAFNFFICLSTKSSLSPEKETERIEDNVQDAKKPRPTRENKLDIKEAKLKRNEEKSKPQAEPVKPQPVAQETQETPCSVACSLKKIQIPPEMTTFNEPPQGVATTDTAAKLKAKVPTGDKNSPAFAGQPATKNVEDILDEDKPDSGAALLDRSDSYLDDLSTIGSASAPIPVEVSTDQRQNGNKMRWLWCNWQGGQTFQCTKSAADNIYKRKKEADGNSGESEELILRNIPKEIAMPSPEKELTTTVLIQDLQNSDEDQNADAASIDRLQSLLDDASSDSSLSYSQSTPGEIGDAMEAKKRRHTKYGGDAGDTPLSSPALKSRGQAKRKHVDSLIVSLRSKFEGLQRKRAPRTREITRGFLQRFLEGTSPTVKDIGSSEESLNPPSRATSVATSLQSEDIGSLLLNVTRSDSEWFVFNTKEKKNDDTEDAASKLMLARIDEHGGTQATREISERQERTALSSRSIPKTIRKQQKNASPIKEDGSQGTPESFSLIRDEVINQTGENSSSNPQPQNKERVDVVRPVLMGNKSAFVKVKSTAGEDNIGSSKGGKVSTLTVDTSHSNKEVSAMSPSPRRKKMIPLPLSPESAHLLSPQRRRQRHLEEPESPLSDSTRGLPYLELSPTRARSPRKPGWLSPESERKRCEARDCPNKIRGSMSPSREPPRPEDSSPMNSPKGSSRNGYQVSTTVSQQVSPTRHRQISPRKNRAQPEGRNTSPSQRALLNKPAIVQRDHPREPEPAHLTFLDRHRKQDISPRRASRRSAHYDEASTISDYIKQVRVLRRQVNHLRQESLVIQRSNLNLSWEMQAFETKFHQYSSNKRCERALIAASQNVLKDYHRRRTARQTQTRGTSRARDKHATTSLHEEDEGYHRSYEEVRRLMLHNLELLNESQKAQFSALWRHELGKEEHHAHMNMIDDEMLRDIEGILEDLVEERSNNDVVMKTLEHLLRQSILNDSASEARA